MLQIALGHGLAVLFEVSRRSAEHMPLTAQITVPPRRRPNVRAAYAHHHVHVFFHRIDKPVRKRQVRLQLRVLLHTRQHHRQRL